MAINQMNLPPLRKYSTERLPMNELTNLVQDLLCLQARRPAPVLPLGEAGTTAPDQSRASAEQQPVMMS